MSRGRKAIDLHNQTFGYLTVLDRADNIVRKNGGVRACWRCKCVCGNVVVVPADALKSGNTKSCGCYVVKQAQRMGKANQQHNDYVICKDYVIFYTTKNEPFFVDIDDFGRVRKYCWWKDSKGYLRAKVNGRSCKLHRFIMNCPSNKNVDHKHGSSTVHDNRKSNLRIVTQSKNTMNSDVRCDSTSKVTGVSLQKNGKWRSYIYVAGKQIRLGVFSDKDMAIEARRKAEDLYFGEYSRNNSRKQ